MAAIIFDMDGTIADSFDFVVDFLAKEAGLGKLSGEQKQELRGLSMLGVARHLGYRWWHAPRLYYKGRHRMRKVIKHVDTFDGIPSLIQKLNGEGHELFVVSTNSLRNVRHFLKEQHLHKYFLQIYGGAGVFSKATALRRLLREQHLEIDQAVYVGDEMRDVEAAQSIGLRIVAVTWGFASRDNLKSLKPTGLADTPDELLKILEEI